MCACLFGPESLRATKPKSKEYKEHGPTGGGLGGVEGSPLRLRVSTALSEDSSTELDSTELPLHSPPVPVKERAQQAGGGAGAPGEKGSVLGVCCQVLLGAHSGGNVPDQLLHSRENWSCAVHRRRSSDWDAASGTDDSWWKKKAKGSSSPYLSARSPLVESPCASIPDCADESALLTVSPVPVTASHIMEIHRHSCVTSLLGELRSTPKLHVCSHAGSSVCRVSASSPMSGAWKPVTPHLCPLPAGPSWAHQDLIHSSHLPLPEDRPSQVVTELLWCLRPWIPVPKGTGSLLGCC